MQQLDEFTHFVYGAILDAEKWKVALGKLAQMAEAPRAALVDSDLAASVTYRQVYHGMGEAENQVYLTEYAAIDPRLPMVLGHNKLTWLSDYDAFDEAFRSKERIYSEFLVPGGVGESIVATFAREGSRIGTALLARNFTQPKVPPAIRQDLDLAMPHLDRAVKLARKFESLTSEMILSHTVLDALAEPLACLLANGAVHRANAAFDSTLRTGRIVSINKGVLNVRDKALQSRLYAAIRECCRIAEGGVAASPSQQLTLRIDITNGPPAFITVAPLAAAHFRSWAGRRCALLRIDQSGCTPDPAEVAAALTLSLAEARLVCTLCGGGTLADAARKLDISINTAKTQLASVFSKTNTSRQSELIGLVSTLPRQA
ncbi:MAG TPA: hypothetical protein VHB46_11010 [Burkholderiales bacterium]|nr:hypothetical protein [Burkholderiales bacterium]